MTLLNEATEPGPVHKRIVLFSWLGWLSVFCTLIVFLQLTMLFRDDFGLDDRAVTRVKSMALAATGLGGLLFGVYADRAGRKRAMMVSIVVYVSGTALAGMARGLDEMVLCAAMAGLGIGGQWAAGQTLLGETVPPRLRGRLGSLAQTGAPLGLGLATVLATLVAPRLGWRHAFWIACAPILLVPLIALLIPESDVWKEHRAEIERGERIDRAKLADLFAPDVGRLFIIAFVLTLFNMANYWFTFSWLPEFLGREWHLTIQKTGAWTLVFVGGSLTGYLLYGICSDLWGRRRAFTLFCVIMASGLAMITLFQDAIHDRPAMILLFVFIAGVGTGTWSNYGPMYTELFPTRVRNTAGGICMNVTRGIQFVAPLMVVAVGGSALAHGIALAAAFALAAGFWVWLLPETRGRVVRAESA